jgi:hypothetical protein
MYCSSALTPCIKALFGKENSHSNSQEIPSLFRNNFPPEAAEIIQVKIYYFGINFNLLKPSGNFTYGQV